MVSRENRRVAITGLGVISPVGLDVATAWQSMISGKSGISSVREMPPDLMKALGLEAPELDKSYPDVKIFGFVKGFSPEAYMEPKSAKRMDRFAQFAVAAAKQAIGDAGIEALLKNNACLRDETAVIIGTGNGGQMMTENQHKTLMEKGPERVSPFAIPMIMLNAAASNIALNYGLRGASFGVVSACASGTDAIINAYKEIRDGDAIIAVTGGTESALTPMAVAAFANMRALAKDYNEKPQAGSRPFDKKRGGFVFSEGAAVLVLEDLEHALGRNAIIYAEITGYGRSNDAHHITEPSASGQALAFRRALKNAALVPEDVDYINAHGTSTEHDKTETETIKLVFGQHAYKLLVSSTKSMTGHLAGGAGALETLVCALAIKNRMAPPTINLESPDVEKGCDLNYVPNVAVNADIEVAMKASFGFGGHNSVLALRKYQP